MNQTGYEISKRTACTGNLLCSRPFFHYTEGRWMKNNEVFGNACDVLYKTGLSSL